MKRLLHPSRLNPAPARAIDFEKSRILVLPSPYVYGVSVEEEGDHSTMQRQGREAFSPFLPSRCGHEKKKKKI
jgi:hypothetical protein